MMIFASFYAKYLQANMNGLEVEIDIWQLIVWPPMFVIVMSVLIIGGQTSLVLM